jgi:hypothetical protein
MSRVITAVNLSDVTLHLSNVIQFREQHTSNWQVAVRGLIYEYRVQNFMMSQGGMAPMMPLTSTPQQMGYPMMPTSGNAPCYSAATAPRQSQPPNLHVGQPQPQMLNQQNQYPFFDQTDELPQSTTINPQIQNQNYHSSNVHLNNYLTSSYVQHPGRYDVISDQPRFIPPIYQQHNPIFPGHTQSNVNMGTSSNAMVLSPHMANYGDPLERAFVTNSSLQLSDGLDNPLIPEQVNPHKPQMNYSSSTNQAAGGDATLKDLMWYGGDLDIVTPPEIWQNNGKISGGLHPSDPPYSTKPPEKNPNYASADIYYSDDDLMSPCQQEMVHENGLRHRKHQRETYRESDLKNLHLDTDRESSIKVGGKELRKDLHHRQDQQRDHVRASSSRRTESHSSTWSHHQVHDLPTDDGHLSYSKHHQDLHSDQNQYHTHRNVSQRLSAKHDQTGSLRAREQKVDIGRSSLQKPIKPVQVTKAPTDSRDESWEYVFSKLEIQGYKPKRDDHVDQAEKSKEQESKENNPVTHSACLFDLEDSSSNILPKDDASKLLPTAHDKKRLKEFLDDFFVQQSKAAAAHLPALSRHPILSLSWPQRYATLYKPGEREAILKAEEAKEFTKDSNIEISRNMQSCEASIPTSSPSKDLVTNNERAQQSNWSCHACTYINEENVTICGMCGKSRDHISESRSPNPGAECIKCTLVNAAGKEFCDACGASLNLLYV